MDLAGEIAAIVSGHPYLSDDVAEHMHQNASRSIAESILARLGALGLVANERGIEMGLIETLARMWMVCDPNRGGADADDLMLPSEDSDGNTMTTELTGQPRWKWFVPRAEATVGYLAERGLHIVPKGE